MPKPLKKPTSKPKTPAKPKRPSDPVLAANAMFTEHMSRVQQEPAPKPLDFKSQYRAHTFTFNGSTPPAPAALDLPTGVFLGMSMPSAIKLLFVSRSAGARCARSTWRGRADSMAAVALNYFAYNFIKIHSTLRMTPAMAAGVTARLFDVSDLVNLLAESEKKAA